MEFDEEDLGLIYGEAPRATNKLEAAYRMESKTRQFPFVVAIDIPAPRITPVADKSITELIQEELLTIDIVKKKTREFYVFHDVEHFVGLKHHFPHAHEIIHCPVSAERDLNGDKIFLEEKCRGRLIFDIDLSSPLPEMESIIHLKGGPVDPAMFVPADFKQNFERLIAQTFLDYYDDVDVSKFVYGWQSSESNVKLSLHLIVKHAFFSEYWVRQIQIFYTLFQKSLVRYGKPSYLAAIDLAMARRNATFRMLGSSKIGGQPLKLIHLNKGGVDLFDANNPVSIYDCLAGIYHHSHLLAEQCIEMHHINFTAIEDEIADIDDKPQQTTEEVKFRKSIMRYFPSMHDEIEELDLSNEDLAKSIEVFEQWNNQMFTIRDHRKSVINLNRRRRGPCPINGKIHDAENAYLKMMADGQIVFGCYRGCTDDKNHYWKAIGCYKQIIIAQINNDQAAVEVKEAEPVKKMGRPSNVVPLNMGRLAKALVSEVKVSDINPITGKPTNKIEPKKQQRTVAPREKFVPKSVSLCAHGVIQIDDSITRALMK